MTLSINLLPGSYQSNLARSARVRILKIVTLYSSLLMIPIVTVLYLLNNLPQPEISPLANHDQPEVIRQSLTERKESLAYYLSASQKYLDNARSQSKLTATRQTKSDKIKIVSLLNESLRSANSAVKYYPESSESFAQRAKVLRALAVIDPSAADQAISDEKIAADLGGGNVPKVNPEDLILYQPIQEASLSDNVIIALPEDDSVAEIESMLDVNATRGTAVIKAGETTVTVNSIHVTNDNLVYFTPDKDTQNEILSLSSKNATKNEFTLKLTQSLSYDLPITWWIVK